MSTTPDPISGRILVIRGQRVILDGNLAELYGVPTFRFNEAVKRNADKFPEDFRFSTYPGRVRRFEIAICDIKRRSSWRGTG